MDPHRHVVMKTTQLQARDVEQKQDGREVRGWDLLKEDVETSTFPGKVRSSLNDRGFGCKIFKIYYLQVNNTFS